MTKGGTHPAGIGRAVWRYRQWILWVSLVAIIGGEGLFWWKGAEAGAWDLPTRSYYTALQGEPVTGLARVVVDFRHFFLFWRMPPDTATYHSFHDLWVSDRSSPWRNLLHVVIFTCAPFVLVLAGRIRAWEALLWLQSLNVLREYVGEGWRLEPSFVDLWVGTICMLIGTWLACKCKQRRTHRSPQPSRPEH